MQHERFRSRRNKQKFAYRSDLTIQLASSVGSVVGGVTYANGLCIDAQTLNTGGTAPLLPAARSC